MGIACAGLPRDAEEGPDVVEAELDAEPLEGLQISEALPMGSLGPVEEETERPDEVVPELLALDDVVEHAVAEEEFRSLETLGQLFLDGLFDDSRARRSRSGPGARRC